MSANYQASRPLKFRVWDGREMHYFPDLTEWDVEDYSEFSRLIHQGCKVMQFTGVMDAFGESEIYEGDKILHGCFEFVVEYDDTGACFYLSPIGDTIAPETFEDGLNFISGHIYDGRKGA